MMVHQRRPFRKKSNDCLLSIVCPGVPSSDRNLKYYMLVFCGSQALPSFWDDIKLWLLRVTHNSIDCILTMLSQPYSQIPTSSVSLEGIFEYYSRCIRIFSPISSTAAV